MLIWTAGRIIDENTLTIVAADRTFEHGLGLFETLRTWSGTAPLLVRHLKRMTRSAETLGLPLDPRALPEDQAVADLCQANRAPADVVVRITLSGGRSERDGAVVWMRLAPLPLPPLAGGAIVAAAPWLLAPDDPLARHKTLNYWSRRRALEHGVKLKADEVLFSTPDGRIWEGSRTNLFLIKGETLVTPGLDGPILPGIMRGLVLEQAEALGLRAREHAVHGLDLPEADEVFLTNSVRGVIPVRRLLGLSFKAPGPWTLRLRGRVEDWLGQEGELRMSHVADVVRWLEAFAPSRLAEDWDNVGLLWGDPAASVSRIMTCLTVTGPSADEAIEGAAELIVSHHPVLFRAARRVRADCPDTGMLWRLARAGVSILSPHTAFDNTTGGINDGLAEGLGLVDVRPLRPRTAPGGFKVVVFTPRADREAVLAAAFAAGAGRIGAYDECSFTTTGVGTFFGTAGANPAVGQAGRRETVRERRIELVCPAERLAAVLEAIRRSHSYEEPAIDAYPLNSTARPQGAGRIGRLPEATSLEALARRVAARLPAPALQYAGPPDRPIVHVAIVCGAGDDFVGDAVRAGADVLLTGEARFHNALAALGRDIGLIVAGHHATERPGVEELASLLARSFPGVEVWASRRESDPLQPAG